MGYYWALNEVNTLIRRSRDRARRVFRSAKGWHLLTREGMTVGPYDTRTEAEAALRAHFEITERPGHGVVRTRQQVAPSTRASEVDDES
ncbi:MAG TPA: DUF6316 family protein [Pseudomonadales bacterium]|nr:DUF6316 family protein [Pseudomonadales bacterium]